MTSSDPQVDRLRLIPCRHVGNNRMYDNDYGYGALHHRAFAEACKFKRAIPPDRLHPLVTAGVAVVPALTGATTKRLQTYLDASEEGVVSPASMGREEAAELMSEILDGDIGDAVRQLFGSEFGAVFMEISRNWDRKGMEGRGRRLNSTRWHCDGGPTEQCRILVYLSGADEHDSGTWIADLQATDALKRCGYVFCKPEERLTDLLPLTERLGLRFEPRLVCPQAGEAILVNPGRRLHRKELPTRGVRDTLGLTLIPAPGGWRRFLDTTWNFLRDNTTAGFPELI